MMFCASMRNTMLCRSVIWVLENNDLAERFEHVLVMEHGRLAERGSVAELKQRGGALQMLLAGG